MDDDGACAFGSPAKRHRQPDTMQVVDIGSKPAADPRAAAAAAADKRFQQVKHNAPAPPSPAVERDRLVVAREKLNKLLVSSIQDYEQHSVLAAAACISVLTKLIGNVLEQPDNDKIRKVRTNSRAFAGHVSPITGGEAFLVEAGWYRRTEDHVVSYIYRHLPDTYHWQLPLESVECNAFIKGKADPVLVSAGGSRLGRLGALRYRCTCANRRKLPHRCLIGGECLAVHSLLHVADEELRKAGSHADEKVERVTSASFRRTKAEEEAEERTRIQLQIRGDKATRKDKFVYG